MIRSEPQPKPQPAETHDAPADARDANAGRDPGAAAPQPRRRSYGMINKVILVGNLGRDPEIRSLPSGQPVASFSVATSRRFKDRDGQRQEQTEWHNIVCFGKQAEIAGQYLVKGKQVFIEGRIQTRSWDDKNSGEKKYRTEIICENFQMLGGGPGGGGGRGGGVAQTGPDYDNEPSFGGGGGGAGGGSDDDIPF